VSVKGRRAKRTLDTQCAALRFPQRQAVVSGRGMDPCPEPETRAVLLLSLSKRSAQALGIVTRKGGDINPVNDSVSAANRARKGAQPIFELIETFTTDTSIELGDRIHELAHIAFTADHHRSQLEELLKPSEQSGHHELASAIGKLEKALAFRDACRNDLNALDVGACRDASEWIDSAARAVVDAANIICLFNPTP